MKPLTYWYCDNCGEKIDDPGKGYVIWRSDQDRFYYDFRIIHQARCDDKAFGSSKALNELLGPEGATYLLSFLSYGLLHTSMGRDSVCRIKDMDGFVDLFRRLQTPFYEQARRHFQDEKIVENHYDSSESYPYFPENLKKIFENSK